LKIFKNSNLTVFIKILNIFKKNTKKEYKKK